MVLLRPPTFRRIRLALTLVAAALAGASTAQSSAPTCDLRLLTTDDAAAVYDGVREHLIDPGANQRAVVAAAGAYLAPLQCAAVEAVAYVEDAGDESSTMGWVYVNHHNDTVHVDARPARASEDDLDPSVRPRVVANVWGAAIETLVHESTHAATHLLHTQVREGDCIVVGIGCDRPTDASQWGADARGEARRVADRARLGGGFLNEWARLHASFVGAGMARAYGDDDAPSVPSGASDATLTAAGFMTSYGSTEPSEDVAEMAAQVQAQALAGATFAGVVVDAPRSDAACRELRSGDGTLTDENAAVFTKLTFLRDVELVSEGAYERCVGDAAIDTRDADGFHLFDRDGGHQQTFGDLVVTMGTHAASGRIVFALEGRGTAAFGSGDDRVETPAEIRLVLDLADGDVAIERVSWPRGLYRFGVGVTSFSLTLEDAPAGTFVASHGFVLVTSATADRIEGSIVLQRADRPFAPMGVPYAASELPRVTFRVSSSR